MPEAGEQHLPDCRVHERGPEGLRTDRWGHVPPVCISPSCRCGLQTLLDRRCSKRPFNERAGFWGKTFKHVQIREHEQPIIQTWTIQVPKGTLETGRQAPPGGKRIRWPKGVRWRRRWHPTPVLLSGKSHGRRSLVVYSSWGREESDMTERLHFHFSLSCTGEGNGNPLQYCLENPRDESLVGCCLWSRTESDTTEAT